MPAEVARRFQSGVDSRSLQDGPLLPVDVQRRDGGAVVLPRGELDIATAPTLSAALDGIHSGRLVVDLRDLSFIDSTGLHLLLDLHRRSQSDGFELTLVAPGEPAARAIRLSGLDEALPFVAPSDAVDGRPTELRDVPRGLPRLRLVDR